MLTHANLLANIRAIGQAVGVRNDDVGTSWLPLYHDMGLIGAWLVPLYFGLPLAVMSPMDFLSRPERWLRMVHRHRGLAWPPLPTLRMNYAREKWPTRNWRAST